MKKLIIILTVITAMTACSKTTTPTSVNTASYAQPTATPGMKTFEQGERYCDFSARAMHGAYSTNDRLYVVSGRGVSGCTGDVWQTNDCEIWAVVSAKTEFIPRQAFGSIVFNNKMWIIAGSNKNMFFNDVWSSPDGVSWTAAVFKIPAAVTTTVSAATSTPILAANPFAATITAKFDERAGLGAAVFKDSMFIAGGSNNRKEFSDVWTSKDGIAWTKVKEDNDKGFVGRSGHKLLVHAGKLWIIGGKTGADNYLSDVWSSENGIDWKIATPNAGFTPRSDFAAITYKERMWVIGGIGAKNIQNSDVWWTVNGYYWISSTAKAEFGTRSGLTAVEYKGQVYVVGGMTEGKPQRDIWASQ